MRCDLEVCVSGVSEVLSVSMGSSLLGHRWVVYVCVRSTEVPDLLPTRGPSGGGIGKFVTAGAKTERDSPSALLHFSILLLSLSSTVRA